MELLSRGMLQGGHKYNEIKKRANGFTQISNYFIDQTHLTSYEKLVVIVLRRHMIGKDYCWIGLETIAKKSCCSITTAKKAVKGLIAKGVIGKTKSKEHKSNVYSIKKWAFNRS